MKKLVVIICLAIGISNARAQKVDSVFIRSIANEVLVNARAYENLRMLTKQIGARLTGSPQMVKAEKWAAKALEVAGADKVWLQQCMVPHWVRGGKDAAIATYTTGTSSKKTKTAGGYSFG